LVSDDGLAAAMTPDIIVNGSIYLAWIDNRNGNNDLYSQTFDTNGTKLWEDDLKINDDLDAADQLTPKIIINPAGQVIYVWVDDRSGDYDIYASSDNGSYPTILGNVSFTLTGSKLISENPEIFKYQQNFSTSTTGTISIPELEWDTYSLSSISGGLDIVSADPSSPLDLAPGIDLNWKLYLD